MNTSSAPTKLEWCARCSVPYCVNCEKEWAEPCKQMHIRASMTNTTAEPTFMPTYGPIINGINSGPNTHRHPTASGAAS